MKDERRWRAIVHTAGKYHTVTASGTDKNSFVEAVADRLVKETEPWAMRDWLNWQSEGPRYPLPLNPPNILMAQTSRVWAGNLTADVVDIGSLTHDVVRHIILNIEEEIQSHLPQRDRK